MKYEKVILVTPENEMEQAQFESDYPNLQCFTFRTLKTFIIPVDAENAPHGEITSKGVLVKNYHLAAGVLKDYFGIVVPDSILVETIGNNPALRDEIVLGHIEDPEQRTKLVNALLRELGQPAWPAAGTEQRLFQNFLINLSIRLTQVGGKLKYHKV